MAKRHLSAKQIKAGFGGKRRKSAARSRPKKRRHAPAKKRVNSAPRKVHSKKRSTHRKRTVKRVAKRRRNPVPQIISWAAGNPARKKGKRKMAHSKKRRKSSARRNTAGRSHSKKRMTRRRHRNPGSLGGMKDWVMGGAGVLGGVVGTRAIPQMILGASNVGPMGYAANAVTALGLGWLTNMLFKGNRTLVAAVIAGGFAATLSRIIADKTPFGAQFSLSGLGDWSGLGLYQKSNYPYPPRVQNGRLPSPGSSMFTWGDGSQGRAAATMASGGTDSTAAC